MTESPLPVLFLMGPTASGKTQLALELHGRLPVEIVSVDSAMVYRTMDIGTAKPGPEVLARAPHHLVDICDPAEIYSAGRFRTDARGLIRAIQRRGKIPLLTGGTGLYFRTLEHGLSNLPPANPVVRERLQREAAELGLAALHARLAGVDPEAAGRIRETDPQRIQRALEVYEITGKSMSSLLRGGRLQPLRERTIKLVLAPGERDLIHQRVKTRFLEMIELGLIDEVKALHARTDLHAALPSMRMVGYRQIWRYLDGAISYREMLEHAIVATRQLAKRQLTWLRSEDRCHWFDSGSGELEQRIMKFLGQDPDLREML